MKENGIPIERFSNEITRTNKYGNKLIEKKLCKRCSVHIANGRLDKDRFIGNTTCKDASLVDYLILSPNVFDVDSEYEVVDFNPMFSDVSNRLHFSFDLGKSQGDPNTQQNVKKGSTYVRWKPQYTTKCKKKGSTYVRWKPHKSNEFNQMLGDDTGNVLQR